MAEIEDNPGWEYEDLKELRPDYEKISAFLSDKEQYLPILQDIDKNVDPDPTSNTHNIPLKLSLLMAEVEQKAAGLQWPPVTVTGGLDTDPFLDLLAKRRPIKDLGPANDHGEHTHRLQWVMIAWKSRPRIGVS